MTTASGTPCGPAPKPRCPSRRTSDQDPCQVAWCASACRRRRQARHPRRLHPRPDRPDRCPDQDQGHRRLPLRPVGDERRAAHARCPIILGHEGAGEVVEVGDHVTTVKPGDHVIVNWTPACGDCPSCLAGQPYLCMTSIAWTASPTPRFRLGGDTPAFGMAGCGTLAEEIVVPWQGAIKVDPDVPFEVAALIGCGVTTGVGAVLNTAQVAARLDRRRGRLRRRRPVGDPGRPDRRRDRRSSRSTRWSPSTSWPSSSARPTPSPPTSSRTRSAR